MELIYNSFQNLIKFVRRKIYLIAIVVPTFFIMLLYFNNYLNLTKLIPKTEIIKITPILINVLLAGLAIITLLPKNKFITRLYLTGHKNIIFKTNITGIIFFILTLIISLLSDNLVLINFLFIIGLTEFIIALYQNTQTIKYTLKLEK